MLYMCFHIGELRYALQARSVASVIPRVPLQPCAELNTTQTGSLLFKQQLLPVFDLCQILRHQPAEAALSTRILILTDDQDARLLCGIIVEQATGTIRLDKLPDTLTQNSRSGSLTETVQTRSGETIQLIKLPQLMEMLLNTTIVQHNINNNIQTGTIR
ncbi:MAG TPA: chemotaxis protein CheW [Gammaproteobacteria bacterium]|nr:chemotaxis protein CheW [Gammaproteobacteria bacterium]